MTLSDPSIEPLSGGLTPPEPPAPKPGDWVKVWAQVVGDASRPEDITIDMSSKSDQFSVTVRREHVETTTGLPDFVGQCSRLFEKKPNVFARCTLHPDHNMTEGHVGPKGERWWDDATAGYFEER